MQEILVGLTLILSSVFLCVAAFGVWRMRDVYVKAHCSSLASTLGCVLALLSLVIYFPQIDIIFKSVLALVLLFLSVPVATHLLIRSSKKRNFYSSLPTSHDDWP
jgi:multicomponent Na+:H+ antiporter subunit G